MLNKGKLVVIDGLDGTGKATQVEMLKNFLINEGKILNKDFAVVDFPRYGHESAHTVESYLNGKFGTNPNDMDAYTSSMFYAIDRAISYKIENWGRVYDNGGLVIADRYTCSNIIHQAGKLKLSSDHTLSTLRTIDMDQFYQSADFCDFIKWLYRTEYDYIGIPTPDLVIYLKLSEEANNRMLKARMEKEHSGDIHETNESYLNTCRKVLNAYEMLMSDPNIRIRCGVNDITYKISHAFIQADDDFHNIKSKAEVHAEILKTIANYNLI